jgi:rare lipoprotein A (peptidoglycan hydrolase)
MPMTAGQRVLFVTSLGLLFLSTPGRAALEKIKIAPPVQTARPVTLKCRMIASWYGQKFQGRLTASGESFDKYKLTAAHKTLPLGSVVKLTVKSTGRSVTVRVNDRGPWIKGRDFDLSEEAATELGIHDIGIAIVEAALVDNRAMVLAGAARR